MYVEEDGVRKRVVTVVMLLATAAIWSRHETTTGAQEVATRAVAAATTYLGTLGPDLRARTLYAFDSDQKPRWHNGPPNTIVRPGLLLGSMTPTQRDAALALVEAVLSPSGYQKVLDIMDADTEFGLGGANFDTGPDAYSLAIYGQPSATAPWHVQFNGHHLGLNVAMVGAQNVLAPTLTGALPATFQRDGKTVRVLGEETDSAFALINMLTPEQRAVATLGHLTGDLVLGPGQDGKVIEPEGLPGSQMTARQKEGLLRVTAAWINMLDRRAANSKLEEVRQNLDQTYFAWGGETSQGQRAYFRIHGPTVYIEYGPQVNAGRRGGGPVDTSAPPPGGLARNRDPNHVHTIFRDFTNDYARKFTR